MNLSWLVGTLWYILWIRGCWISKSHTVER